MSEFFTISNERQRAAGASDSLSGDEIIFYYINDINMMIFEAE